METRIAPRQPGPALAPWVVAITDFALGGPMPAALSPADLVVPLVINFAAPWSIGFGPTLERPERAASFAAGLWSGPVHIGAAQATACLQIDLTPPGALRLLRRPLAELAGGLAPLDALDRDLARLTDRLANTPAAEGRLDIAQDWLIQRLADAQGDPRLDAAFAALARGRGDRVADVADHVNLCRQQLARRFTAAFGLPPRAVSRIGRFQRARRMAAAGRATGWADLAALAGYADQAHLSREFRELSGTSPGRWPG